ncbi:DUF7604 domain-containing protein [Pseudobutyrivibrio ruminis]|uniref:DUF7604 domain-containing protein n=1 Tax=Pseudobutyrivibrio ruminis TaxID=46206 RepID=UPI000406E4B7|nr:VWA domain-containing protein [Pseudobutyrivibrio ruminis]
MRRNRLFNKIISLSLVIALYLSMSASAYAELETEVPAVESNAVVEEVNNAQDVPAEPVAEVEETTEPQPAEEPSDATASTNIVGEIVETIKETIGDVVAGDSEEAEETDDEESADDAEAEETDDEEPVDDAEEPEEENIECEHELQYSSNNDGTHNVTCSKCEELEEYTESCDFDEEGVCTKCGYKRLPDPILTYEDDEIIVKVSGAVPQNADLKVTPIKADVEETAEAFKQVKEKVDETTKINYSESLAFVAYDIGFVSIETNEVIEPDGDVTVSMEYKKQVNPVIDDKKDKVENIDISLLHIDEESQSVETLTGTDKATLEVDGDKLLTKAEFTNDSFSPYVFVYKTSYQEEKINLYFDSITKDGDNLVNIQDETTKTFSISTDENHSDYVENFKDDIAGYRFVEAGYMVNGEMVKFDNFRYTFTERYMGWGVYYYDPSLQLYLGNVRVAGNIKFENQQIIIYMFYEKDVAFSVSKIVTGPPAADTDTEYQFQLSGGDGVKNKQYKNGENTYSTDSEGKFTLKAGESADFATFTPGTYTITELGISTEADYTIHNFKTKIFINGVQDKEYAPESEAVRQSNSFTVEEGKLTEVKIKNYYYTKLIESQKEAVSSKYLRYNEETDDYQIQIKFTGPEIVKKETSYETEAQDVMTAKDVHITYVVDRSFSMRTNSRASHMQQASKTLAEIMKTKKNVNASWKIVDFGSNAVSSPNWMSTDAFYDEVKGSDFAWYYTDNEGGTNYEAALLHVKNILDNDNSDAQKIVIFLTDGLSTVWLNDNGVPTWYNSTGTSFEPKAYREALAVVKNLKPDAFYSIGVDFGNDTYKTYDGVARNAEWFLTNLTNSSKAKTKKTSTVKGDKLVSLFKDLAGVISSTETGGTIENTVAYHAEDVLINDPLSDYVDIEDGSTLYIGIRDNNIPVTADDPNANELQKLGRGNWRNGIIDSTSEVVNNHDDTSINIAEYDIYETDESGNTVTYTVSAYYDKDSRSIKMIYPEGYQLPANYSFVVSFNVVPSDKAYEEYYQHQQSGEELYNAVGDPFTDHVSVPEENWTSSGKPGFNSNGDAKVTYDFCGNTIKDKLPHPVIQVRFKYQWEIYKTDADGKSGERLEGAQFLLKEAGDEPEIAYLGTSSIADNNAGKVIWDLKNDKAIPVNKTYIITEEAAPTGYAKCDDHWELTLDENNIPTVTAIAKQGVATEYESEVVREKNLITYKFYYKNIRKIANMPNTGGKGTTKGRAFGFTLIMISAFILYRSRKTKGMYKRG